MSIADNLQNAEVVFKACMASLDKWIRLTIHHSANYKLETPTESQISISFVNRDVLQHLIEKLCCKLHSCDLEDVVNSYTADLKSTKTLNEDLNISEEEEYCNESHQEALKNSPSVKEIGLNYEHSFKVFLQLLITLV